MTAAAPCGGSPRLPAELDSRRLLIRVAAPGDGLALSRAMADSLDRLQPWLPWATPAPNPLACEHTCRQAHARFLLDEDLMVFFFLKSTGELVGGGGLHNPRWDLLQFEVGYWGHAAHAGQGLIHEGMHTLVQHALHALRASRIFLTTDELNAPSRRLAERLGFRLEGTLRRERRNLQGGWRNTCVYGLLPTDVGPA